MRQGWQMCSRYLDTYLAAPTLSPILVMKASGSSTYVQWMKPNSRSIHPSPNGFSHDSQSIDRPLTGTKSQVVSRRTNRTICSASSLGGWVGMARARARARPPHQWSRFEPLASQQNLRARARVELHVHAVSSAFAPYPPRSNLACYGVK